MSKSFGKNKFYIFFLFCNIFFFNKVYCHDLTLVGSAIYTDGICRFSISLIDMLRNDLDLNFILSGLYDPRNIPLEIKNILELKNNKIGNVSVLLDSPWNVWTTPYKVVPDSKIKLAYSMLESDKIPDQWAKIFNKYFDAVIVPDDFLVDVYKNSGVIKPIFVIPMCLYLEDFLAESIKNKKNKVFTFGCSAAFFEHKNQALLVDAFYKAFGNLKNVQLLIHGRWGEEYDSLTKKIATLNTDNIKIIHKQLSHSEYLNFFKSLDCYVLISKGEGFSITPREALAMGIPCILSDNTAHQTICKTGLVKAIKSTIEETAYFVPFGFECGHKFNCNLEDVVTALKEVYSNYDFYLQKASQGRIWVQQYLHKNLKPIYLNIIKPKKVLLGNENKVTKDFLITNCKELYEKYLQITNVKNHEQEKDYFIN